MRDGIVAFATIAPLNRRVRTACRAAADEALAAPLAGLARVRRKAGESSDLLSVELSELGQLGNQRAGNHWPDAGRRLRPAGSPSHARPANPHGSSISVVNAVQFLFQRFYKPCDALACRCLKVTRFSRWRSAPIISMICRRLATRSASKLSPRRATDAFRAWPPRRSARYGREAHPKERERQDHARRHSSFRQVTRPRNARRSDRGGTTALVRPARPADADDEVSATGAGRSLHCRFSLCRSSSRR